MTIPEALRNPPQIPLKRLVRLTRHYHAMSAQPTTSPRSFYTRWYNVFACECEGRGYNLTKVLKGKHG